MTIFYNNENFKELISILAMYPIYITFYINVEFYIYSSLCVYKISAAEVYRASDEYLVITNELFIEGGCLKG
jgi:hypothetical protein